MWTLEGRFTREALHSRVRLLESGQEAGFQNSIEIINTLKCFSDDTSTLLKTGSRHTVSNDRLKDFVCWTFSRKRNEKYLNRDEVQMCLQMAKQLLNEGDGNIMLPTPVRENIMYMFVYQC
jgi:hypothetical protein